ncbi:hypothetical protein SS1G_05530 [Sclerotinia sclerotiorum 1980 UF-70]|uniref:Non-specific serine/threonine protein kinase n=2 Tax=Sclerotinia sclerotiorum (strain ATCC 18683 / 1980 / Ss-1) TaxID=665079 RepID=A7EJN6_SCLS1|nr:hypothetical protein SS1G_05530 [Sclerotinia sclerotiorum 1980 UF-70]APA11967.1 hypothetical protein sscle_08g067370 [Sclerotinia sclerotiorum 1980 UF-70]EDO03052.1 hypothetical protein SS1G_05530 [Sclerotinia sclerotiorum 1980 UF-70]
MMIIIRTPDLPPPPPPPPPPLPSSSFPMTEDANEQHKVLQVQFPLADYKFQLCETSNDRQMDLDMSNSETVTVKVTAQQINPGGNNCIFICRYPSANDQDPDSDNNNNNDFDSKLPKIFVAKEFGDSKDELDTYEHLASLQGVYIPKCFGEIYWKDEDGLVHKGIALEFLEGFRRLDDTDAKNDLMYWKYKKALEAIGNKGIFHGDVAFRNLMWHPQREEVRVIDFDQAKAATEEWRRDGKSVKEQNFIELEGLFKVEDSDIIREYLPMIYAKPRWMLDPPILPKKIRERF